MKLVAAHLVRATAAATRSLLGLVLLCLFFAGCPGSLEDRERFLSQCGGIDQPLCSTMTSTIPPGTEEIAMAILEPSCGRAGCHAGAAPQQGLDLSDPALERLLGRTSSSAACSGETMLIAGDPEGSLLFDKLSATPRCGLPMPPGAPLDEEERALVRAWIAGLREE